MPGNWRKLADGQHCDQEIVILRLNQASEWIGKNSNRGHGSKKGRETTNAEVDTGNEKDTSGMSWHEARRLETSRESFGQAMKRTRVCIRLATRRRHYCIWLLFEFSYLSGTDFW